MSILLVYFKAILSSLKNKTWQRSLELNYLIELTELIVFVR